MNKKVVIAILVIIFLVSSCSKVSNILGEYEYSDTVYIGGLSSSTIDYMKETKIGTQYSINRDSIIINFGDDTTQLLNIKYKKEKLTDEIIEENYMTEDTSLMDFYSGFEQRLRYSIYSEDGGNINYYIYVLDGRIFISSYAKTDKLIFAIDEIKNIS